MLHFLFIKWRDDLSAFGAFKLLIHPWFQAINVELVIAWSLHVYDSVVLTVVCAFSVLVLIVNVIEGVKAYSALNLTLFVVTFFKVVKIVVLLPIFQIFW